MGSEVMRWRLDVLLDRSRLDEVRREVSASHGLTDQAFLGLRYMSFAAEDGA